jgi:hypothetical protein
MRLGEKALVLGMQKVQNALAIFRTEGENFEKIVVLPIK